MLGPIVRSLLKLFYRVELRGRENYEAAGERTLILHNPGSIIDPLLIAAVLPHRVTLLADKAFELGAHPTDDVVKIVVKMK